VPYPALLRSALALPAQPELCGLRKAAHIGTLEKSIMHPAPDRSNVTVLQGILNPF